MTGCQLLRKFDEFNRSIVVTVVVAVVVVGIIDVDGSIAVSFGRFEFDSCGYLRSVLSASIGVAGGELVSTFVVSRIDISAANERPHAQTKRWP